MITRIEGGARTPSKMYRLGAEAQRQPTALDPRIYVAATDILTLYAPSAARSAAPAEFE